MRIQTPVRSALGILALLASTGLAACQWEGTPEAFSRQGVSAADVRLLRETFLVKDVVPRSATLDALLRQNGLDTAASARVIESVAGVFDPRRLRSLQPFLIERTVQGALRLFEYEIDGESFLRVTPVDRSTDTLRAEVLPIPKTIELGSAGGVIDTRASSLFASVNRSGEGDDLAMAIAAAFSGEIDFNSEVQLGDRFAASFERYQREGRPSTIGKLNAAEFETGGRVYRAFRFAVPGGEEALYDEEGRSVRRCFLKSPLKFEPRITSRFNPSRRHPVLNTIRAHRGVDYGAPTGAPVVAVAAGTVMSVTTDSTNGRMVRLRHASGYQTYYLHLSRFATGLRAGARVEQGRVVGYVGSSGLATGPHLHYGLTKNGVFVDPVAEHRKMPPGEPIPQSAMAAFREMRDREVAILEAARGARPVPGTQLVSTGPVAPIAR
jgi:murein DD-endopeptidase MepM/ murein hydrolase activator NlpD